MIKRLFLLLLLFTIQQRSYCWGFYAHKQINSIAVFLLPPEMLLFYKQHLDFITEHAVDPDKRRYAVAEEGARHYIDIDHYGRYPDYNLPRKWQEAVAAHTEDSLHQYGIVPWWIQTMQFRLTAAFRERNAGKILKLSAEIGHYIGDAHVPLHASGNHNGQLTGQQGIHGFWESRIPELLAEKEWDFYLGTCAYIEDLLNFTWNRVLESAAAADTVLHFEKALSKRFPSDRKYAYEERNGQIIKTYSLAYSLAYNRMLKNMVERRMRQSIFAVASFWYTAWVNAGQPDLTGLSRIEWTAADQQALDSLDSQWRKGALKGRSCEQLP